ncbi:MAG: 4-hydroxy-tetrahydrodipicolinate synthase [Oscillospiraceae bacterium]|nr:4-hydroxy-tetrahydrodipicolinate synthase [Oscillospiraceae bacterium]
MKQPLFTGVCTAQVTPFLNGKINYPMLETLIDRQIDAGVDAIVVSGTTGESAALAVPEKREIVDFAVKYIAGRCKVIAGTGTNATHDAIELSKMGEECGADGLLIVTPYYNKTTQQGLVEHYSAIADCVSLPIIVYNVPSRTGMTITLETYKALSKIPNINGVKEASADIPLISRIMNECSGDLNVWSGNDDTTVAMMALGASGVISTTSNLVPQRFVEMCSACFAQDFKKAAAIQNALMPLTDAMFCEVNPMPVKTALRMAGYAVGPCRLPLCEVTPEHRDLIEKLLPEYGIA